MTQAGGSFDRMMNALTLIAAALLLAVTTTRASRQFIADPATRLVPGDEIAIADVTWAANGRTLVFALQPDCGYTDASIPFYRDLLASLPAGHIRPVLVTPHAVAIGQQMASDYRLDITEIRRASFSTLKAPGSPTLLLVDARGRLVESWVGKLSPAKETDLFARLGLTRAKAATASSAIVDPDPAVVAGATVIDTRDRDEIAVGPIRGALTMPLNELQTRLVHEVPAGTRVVAVCDYCVRCGETRPALPTRCDLVRRVMGQLGFNEVELVGRVEIAAKPAAASGAH